MRDNSLLRTFRGGGRAAAAFVTVPDPFLAEVQAGAGLDALIVDTEHAPMDRGQLQNVLIASAHGSATVLVRVAANDDTLIGQALDSGAEGIVVPGVSTQAECLLAVRAARYPPQGTRGFGPRRASRLHGDRADYLRRANDEVAVLVMIESVGAVQAIEEIVRVPGLSGIFIGTADLAVSMGHLDDLGNPAVDAAAQTVGEAALRSGLPFGVATGTEAAAKRWYGRGAQLVTLGSDLQYIDAGIAATRAMRTRLLENTTD
jgi:2-keto-3-deoxy-L-rhamnonate aldolase RhmA